MEDLLKVTGEVEYGSVKFKIRAGRVEMEVDNDGRSNVIFELDPPPESNLPDWDTFVQFVNSLDNMLSLEPEECETCGDIHD